MQKKSLVIVSILLVLCLSFSFTSANWFSDIFGKITGKVVYQDSEASGSLTGNNLVVYYDFPQGYSSPINLGVLGETQNKTFLTYSAMVKPSISLSMYHGIMGKVLPGNDQFMMALSANSKDWTGYWCGVYTSDGEGRSVDTMEKDQWKYLKKGEWQHIACTYDGTSLKLYLDGELINYKNYKQSKPLGSNNVGFAIGDTGANRGWKFAGEMKEVRVYNRTLSAQEISTLYNIALTKVNVSGSSNVTQNVTLNTTCYDSDGGLNYWVKGRIDVVKEGQNYFLEDSCAIQDTAYSWTSGMNSCSGETCGVFEAHCGNTSNGIYFPNNVVNSDFYKCSNGCIDGACVNGSYLILNNIPPFIFEDQMLEDHIEVSIYMAEYKYNETLGENLVSVFVGKTPGWREIFEEEILEEYLQNEYIYEDSISGKIIVRENFNGRNVYVWISDNKGIVVNQHVGFFSDALLGAYLNKYPSTLTSPQESCDSAVSLIKTPTNISIEGQNWELRDYGPIGNVQYDQLGYLANWRYSKSNEYDNRDHYVSASVALLPDSSAVEESLNNALEYQLCDKQRVYFDYDSQDYQMVYVCKNIWRLASDAQRVSPQNNWNYNNDVVAIWFNKGRLFSMEFSLNDYYTCYDYQSCMEMEQWNHMRKQEDLIRFTDNLLNNQGQWIGSGYLDYLSESFVKYFLKDCPSEVLNEGYLGSWNCRQDPVVCPPHGEQKQTCTRYNSQLGKEETREATISCNPGICFGCMVPRWFGDKWGSKCIEYGFRFRQETGDFEWITESETYSYEIGGYREDVDRLHISHIQYYGERLSLEIYPNNSIDFRVAEWDNVTRHLTNGTIVDLMEILDLELYTPENQLIQLYFQVVDVFYDYENYSNSYVDFLFVEESPIRTYNYTYEQSYQVPVYLNMYCDIDGQVKQQKTQAWGQCQNNFECESNLCSYGECVDLKGIADEVKGFKGFLVRLVCKLSNFQSLFDSEDPEYLQCVANNA